MKFTLKVLAPYDHMSLLLNPIGLFKSAQIEPYQAGRQPDELGLFGKITLNKGENFEQALQDLEGCSHLWIIFGFHLNQNWKPQVSTPRSNKKIGVFATRAPYRPNPIGLSLVELISVNDLTLEVGTNDILNDSPIYDIKPYHPEFDAAPDARITWLESSTYQKNIISFSPFVENQLEFLEKQNVKEIRTFIIRQLEYDPTNKNKKRVEELPHFWTLSYRTWRIDFTLNEDQIGILSLRSGYSEQELLEVEDSYEDKYADKKIHRLFNSEFK
ncbi:MAG: tRNA (N6-threonylcarbamoyladenosine(37)-N6)-methyltransferase TrmO [Bdellovibrionota bacterium]